MAGPAVVRFVLDGTGKAISQANAVGAALKRNFAAGTGGGATSGGGGRRYYGSDSAEGGGSRQGRMYARFGKFAGGATLGRVGAVIANSPTAGIAALGVAAIGVGLALRQFGTILAEQTRRIETSLRTQLETRNKLRDVGVNATQSALSSVLGRRNELVGGGRGTPEVRAFFASADRFQKEKDAAELDRAMRFGDAEMRADLARTKSPEAVAFADLQKEASEQTDLQIQIRNSMSGFQQFFEDFHDYLTGGEVNTRVRDALRNEGAVRAGAP